MLMSDITPMPNNANNYYRKAMNALENNDVAQGIHFLEESYLIDPQELVFKELVNLYLKQQSTSKLKNIWLDRNYALEDLANSSSLTILYAESLLLIDPNSESLNELYQLRDLIQDSNSLKHINTTIDAISGILSTQKELGKLQSNEAIHSFIDFSLNKGQFYLLSKLKHLYRIDLNKTDRIYLAILNRKDVFNFIKNDILHFLISKQFNKTINYYWFNQSFSIHVSELTAYHSTEYYQKTLELISDFFAKQDPHLETQVTELFNLHCMVLYPFYDKAISEPARWLNHTLMMYNLIGEGEFYQLPPLTEDELYYYNQAQEEIMILLSN